MEWPIELDTGQGYNAKLFFSISTDMGFPCIEYTDIYKEQIILDKLSSFDYIEFDELNPLHLTFIGQTLVRSIKFNDEDAISNVWSTLQNFVSFVSDYKRNRAFRITPKESNKSLLDSTLTKFSSIFNTDKNHSDNGLGIGDPEALASNIIRESLSDLQINEVNDENFNQFFDQDGVLKDEYDMTNIDIRFDYAFNLWKRILKVNPDKDDFLDYQKLLAQWNPMSSLRWSQNIELQEFVIELEKHIDDSYLPEHFKKLSFEVIVSCMFLYITIIHINILF